MSASVSLTESGLFVALRTVLLGMFSSVQVVIGQNNRTAAPQGDFIVMTPLLRERLATNIVSYSSSVDTRSAMQETKFTIQLDVFGLSASDNAQIISTLFRDDYACSAFAAISHDIGALYTSDPKQMQFVNSENQYENRWTVDVVLQANIAVTTPQDYAVDLEMTAVSVESLSV